MYTLTLRSIWTILLGMSKHKPITQEMIADLSLIGDKDFSNKWGTSRGYAGKNRKRLGIKPFNNKHGTKEHRVIDGIEEKWCQTGHWERVQNFYKMTSRWDGLRGWCKVCTANIRRERYKDKEKVRQDLWKKSDKGRTSLRNTWRKQKAIKDNAYVLWEPEHEESAYKYFGGRCSYCGKPVDYLKVEFDHFIPIKNGGKTHPNNMLPCCKKCNHGTGGKFTRDALEWLRERFGELNGNMIYLVCQTALEQLGQGIL